MDEDTPRPPRAELSKTPSWVMVGFVLGVLTVLGFQRDRREPVPAGEAAVSLAPAAVPAKAESQETGEERSVTNREDRPSLAVIEAVFDQWGGYALWENEVTEVALWNSVTNDFTDYFEVIRTGSGFYYRSIPRLTRSWTDAKPPLESPLRFTEPLEVRKARLEGRLSSGGLDPGWTGPWKGAPEVAPPKTGHLPPPPAKSTDGGL